MKVARRLIELAINAKTLYESHSAEERIELLKNICSNRVLDGRRAEYHLRSSLAVLSEMKKNSEWRREREIRSRARIRFTLMLLLTTPKSFRSHHAHSPATGWPDFSLRISFNY